MKCIICGSRVKIMYKPDLQFHYRGGCGLIMKFQVGEEHYKDKLESFLNKEVNKNE